MKKRFESTAPKTASQFEKAWLSSQAYKKAQDDQKQFEKEIEENQPAETFREEVRAQKSKLAPKGGNYTSSYWTQIRANTVCTPPKIDTTGIPLTLFLAKSCNSTLERQIFALLALFFSYCTGLHLCLSILPYAL